MATQNMWDKVKSGAEDTFMSMRFLMNVSAVVLAVAMVAVDGGCTLMIVGGILAFAETACGVWLTAEDNSTIQKFVNWLKGVKGKSDEEKKKEAIKIALKDISEYLERNEFEALHGIEVDIPLDNMLKNLLMVARNQITNGKYKLKFKGGERVSLRDYDLMDETTLEKGGKKITLSKEFFVTEKFFLLRWWIDDENKKQDDAMTKLRKVNEGLRTQVDNMQKDMNRLKRLVDRKFSIRDEERKENSIDFGLGDMFGSFELS